MTDRDELIALIGSVIPREHANYGTEEDVADAILAAGYRKQPDPDPNEPRTHNDADRIVGSERLWSPEEQ